MSLFCHLHCCVAETIAEEEEDEPDLCSSNHFILDRIAEKDSTDNLYRAGSESEPETGEQLDIRQVLHSHICQLF